MLYHPHSPFYSFRQLWIFKLVLLPLALIHLAYISIWWRRRSAVSARSFEIQKIHIILIARGDRSQKRTWHRTYVASHARTPTQTHGYILHTWMWQQRLSFFHLALVFYSRLQELVELTLSISKVEGNSPINTYCSSSDNLFPNQNDRQLTYTDNCVIRPCTKPNQCIFISRLSNIHRYHYTLFAYTSDELRPETYV